MLGVGRRWCALHVQFKTVSVRSKKPIIMRSTRSLRRFPNCRCVHRVVLHAGLVGPYSSDRPPGPKDQFHRGFTEKEIKCK